MKPQNLVDKHFGRLTVLKQAPNRGSKRYWLCRCDCGKEHIAAGHMLKRSRTRSCGCLKVEMHTLPGDQGSFNDYFNQYIYGARQRGHDFSLTRDQFREITKLPCSYCGALPQPVYSRNRKVLEVIPYLCSGIDRVNNGLGYEVGNCVSCCSLCNLMKRGLHVEDFKKHVQKISDYLGRS